MKSMVVLANTGSRSSTMTSGPRGEPPRAVGLVIRGVTDLGLPPSQRPGMTGSGTHTGSPVVVLVLVPSLLPVVGSGPVVVTGGVSLVGSDGGLGGGAVVAAGRAAAEGRVAAGGAVGLVVGGGVGALAAASGEREQEREGAAKREVGHRGTLSARMGASPRNGGGPWGRVRDER
jgi:hypothetical protein